MTILTFISIGILGLAEFVKEIISELMSTSQKMTQPLSNRNDFELCVERLCFLNMATKIYNKLPLDIENVNSFKKFQENIKWGIKLFSVLDSRLCKD